MSCQKLDWKAHKKVCNIVVKKKDGIVAAIGNKNNVKGDNSMTNDQGGIPQGEDYYKKDFVKKKGDANSGEFLFVHGGPMIHLDDFKVHQEGTTCISKAQSRRNCQGTKLCHVPFCGSIHGGESRTIVI